MATVTPLFKQRTTSEMDYEQQQYKEPLMFPPLIETVSTYVDAAVDVRTNQAKTEVKAEKKKKRKKKAQVDGSLSTLLTNSMEIVSTSESNGVLTVVQRPVSQKMDAFASPRKMKVISPETNDFRFQSSSVDHVLLSPVKTAPQQGSSPLTDFSAAKVSPRSRTGKMKKDDLPHPPPRTAFEVNHFEIIVFVP